MLCLKCGNLIPQKRLEIIPNTKTCVNCSNESRMKGNIITTGKEGEETVIIEPIWG